MTSPMTHPYTATCAICGMLFEARTSYGLCPLCWNRDRLREIDRLETARRYAVRHHLPATLTLVELLSVISDFQGLCAYCQEISYHWIDMVDRHKGLVYSNVVPICSACKHHREHGFDAALANVKAYLAQERIAQMPLDMLPEEEMEYA